MQKLSRWDLRGGFAKLWNPHLGGGDVKEGDIRNKKENLEIHENDRWAKNVSTTEKVVTWQ